MTNIQRTQLWLACIQQGFVALLPMLFLGALALTFIQFPVYFPSLEGLFVFKVAEYISHATYGLVSLFLVCSISYQLAKAYQVMFDLRIDAQMVSMIAGVTLVVMMYMSGTLSNYSNFGFEHLIHALLVAIVFTELFVCWVRFSPFNLSYLEHEIHGQLSIIIRMIVPAVVLPILMVMIYGWLFMNTAPIEIVILWLVGGVDVTEGLSLWQALKIVILNQLSWFVGIHGTSVIGTVADVIFIDVNLGNFNSEIISHFAYLGGSGCTLGLVMALFLSRRKSNRQFAKYAMVPSLFNINELIIFGLPIVFNRYLFLPFVFMPVLAVLLTSLAVNLGFLTFQSHGIPWSMPFLLGGFLLTDHWSGAVMQLIICVVSALIYWPFMKLHEARQSRLQIDKIKALIDAMHHPDFDARQALRSPDQLGIFCRRIAKDLTKRENLELYYQPKLDQNGKVLGAEALLRWHHPVFGLLPPSIFIPIVEDNQDIHSLDLWIIERCFKDMNMMDRSHGFTKIPIAINISPIQLSDKNFIYELKQRITRFGVDPMRVELEITEGQQLRLDDELVQGLQLLAKMGVRIAVDDFGMGHTSLHYLKSFPVHTIKVDGAIIKDVAHSHLVQEIVQTMGQLAHGMNAILVAEWVEDDEQLKMLHSLGCDQYQGQLFSMPLPLPELVAYCVKHQK
jgi:lactose/cellobiose-specific phosphotransferase system IIC component